MEPFLSAKKKVFFVARQRAKHSQANRNARVAKLTGQRNVLADPNSSAQVSHQKDKIPGSRDGLSVDSRRHFVFAHGDFGQ